MRFWGVIFLGLLATIVNEAKAYNEPYAGAMVKKENKTIKANMEANSARPIPTWLERDIEKLSGKVIKLASREDVDIPVEEHLIVELYSK